MPGSSTAGDSSSDPLHGICLFDEQQDIVAVTRVLGFGRVGIAIIETHPVGQTAPMWRLKAASDGALPRLARHPVGNRSCRRQRAKIEGEDRQTGACQSRIEKAPRGRPYGMVCEPARFVEGAKAASIETEADDHLLRAEFG